MSVRAAGLALLALFSLQDSKQRLKQALNDACADSWIYDDIPGGFAKAKKSGKPLMIVFR